VTILVDSLIQYGTRQWCHLASDLTDQAGVDELNAFADRIGLKREWFQNRKFLPHYDLQPNLRRRAVQAGAIEVSGRDFVLRCSSNPLYSKLKGSR
jgi:hypothetical protein